MTSVPAEELPPPVHDPDVVGREADRIVLDELSDERGALQRVFDALHRGIGDFFGDLFGGVGAGTGIAGLLVQVVLVIAAAVVIGLALRALIRARRARVPSVGDGGGVTVLLGEAVSPDALEEQIRRGQATGDWASVVMARFRLSVADLIHAGVLTDGAGRTTGEYRGEFAESRPYSADEFAAASRMFERAYYGREPMEAVDADAMGEWVGVILREKVAAR